MRRVSVGGEGKERKAREGKERKGKESEERAKARPVELK